MVTLGFYSPWATVRNLRYFYGNTYLESGSFDFHANPVDILKRRLIAIGALMLYSIVTDFIPWSELLFVLVFIPLSSFPAILQRIGCWSGADKALDEGCLKKMQDEASSPESEGDLSGYLSTHPLTEERAKLFVDP